jgi:hypothetical protein
MPSHPPFPYQRTSSDFDRECRGVFRVLHDKGLALDCTYDRPELQAMNSISERPLRWLWQDKIPLGKLTLIEGPPAVGKLFVALDIAARVSTGALCGERDCSPREVPAPLGNNLDASSGIVSAPPGPPFQCRSARHLIAAGVAVRSVVGMSQNAAAASRSQTDFRSAQRESPRSHGKNTSGDFSVIFFAA